MAAMPRTGGDTPRAMGDPDDMAVPVHAEGAEQKGARGNTGGMKLLPCVVVIGGKMYMRIFLDDRQHEDREMSLDYALVHLRQLAQAMQEVGS